MDRNDARYGFFRQFLDTGKGQIIGLATPTDQIRDGMAVALVAGFLGGPKRAGITVEPSRPFLIPAANIVLLGSTSLFVTPDAHRISGGARVVGVGRGRLGERLEHMHAGCCLRIVGDRERVVVNEITKRRFVPRIDPDERVQEDWGVLRRVVRGDVETTIVCEGPHRLGTLGAAMAATDVTILEKIWKRVPELEHFDESRPLEILVRVRFHDEHRQGVHSADTVSVTPWCIVHDRQWVYDLQGGAGWRDQLPWDVHVVARFEEGARPVDAGWAPNGTARLELEADLRDADPRVHAAFREAFGVRRGPVRDAAGVERMLESLVTEGDRFHLFLADRAPAAPHGERRIELGGGASRIRILRERLLVLLVLCRALSRPFPCDEAAVRRYFPEFERGRSKKTLEGKFISDVPGKFLETFPALFGADAKHRKHHVRVPYARVERSYRLRLDQAALVVKIRWGDAAALPAGSGAKEPADAAAAGRTREQGSPADG